MTAQSRLRHVAMLGLLRMALALRLGQRPEARAALTRGHDPRQTVAATSWGCSANDKQPTSKQPTSANQEHERGDGEVRVGAEGSGGAEMLEPGGKCETVCKTCLVRPTPLMTTCNPRSVNSLQGATIRSRPDRGAPGVSPGLRWPQPGGRDWTAPVAADRRDCGRNRPRGALGAREPAPVGRRSSCGHRMLRRPCTGHSYPPAPDRVAAAIFGR